MSLQLCLSCFRAIHSPLPPSYLRPHQQIEGHNRFFSKHLSTLRSGRQRLAQRHSKKLDISYLLEYLGKTEIDNTPILLIFHADFCPPCRSYERNLQQQLKNHFGKSLIIHSVDIENEDHDITSVDPWELAANDKYVLLVPELPLGKMLHGPIAAEFVKDPGIIQSKTGHVLVQSISEQDPVSVKTVGLANCFVSFDKINQCWSLNTESHTSW